MTEKFSGRLRRTGKFLYAVSLMGALAFGGISWYHLNQKFWLQMFDLTPSQVGAVILASMLVVPWLDRMDEWLRLHGWSWFEWSVFPRNINFIPMDYILFRIPFLVLLYFNLPVLAWIEEMVFRHNLFIHATSGFWDALWRSVVFGILHVVGGAKLRTTLPLTVGGMWFSWHYMYGGVEMATISHLAMNTVGLTTMLVSWWRTGKNPFVA